MSRLRYLSLVAAALAVVAFGGRSLIHTIDASQRSVASQPTATLAGVGDAQQSAAGSSSPTGAAGSGDARKPINLGIPTGHFDPVLTQLPPAGRSLPPTNHRCNNPAGEDRSIVQSEVTIATRGDTVVVGWNDGIGFVNPNATISGYGYSVDRGVTWVDGGSVPNGTNTQVYGDPTVIVTNSGMWVFASLDLGSPNGLAINRARFQSGALNWGPAAKYSDGGGFLDKEYLKYDPTIDRIYLTYTGSSGAGRMTWSTNEGATWASPVNVGGGGSGFYAAPGINGEVYVSWVSPLGQGNAHLNVRYSSNSGTSWAYNYVNVHQIGPQAAQPPQCFNRSFNVTFPSMAVDCSNGPHRGRAYYVWSDGAPGNYDCFATYSDDKGQTWATPVRIDDEQNQSEQFWPQVKVAADGRVTVGWYDRRNATNNNSLCDFYVTQSVDGGITWGPNRRVSDTSVAWCGVPANIQPNFGDYIEILTDDKSVYGVWSDARGGGPDVYTGRFDDRYQLAVSMLPPQGARSQFEAAGTAWYIPNETEFVADPAPSLDSPAQLGIAAIGLSTLATPQETNGVFHIGGDALHGNINMSSTVGVVNGTFSIARTGVNGINYSFTATSSDGLNGLMFLPNSTVQATLVPAGVGQANIFGTVTMIRGGIQGPLSFSMAGTIYFDGNPSGVLAANQSINETWKTTLSSTLTVHTRTTVIDGVTSDVPPLSAGTNPPPLGTVRAAPNPLEASTRIQYTLTHPSDGVIQIYAVDGRMVRTVAKGHFEPGSHEVPFDGKDDQGRRLAKGGYFIRLETEGVNAVRVAGKLFVVN